VKGRSGFMTMNKRKNILQSESLIKRDEKALERLVNIIAYIENIDAKTLGLTRLLKYLYIIDEKSVKAIGVPVTNLEYYVAENGPLADQLRVCMLNKSDIFTKHFKIDISKFENLFKSVSNEKCDIVSLISSPNLDVLSRFEINLINETVEKYRGVDTNDIIKELHAEGTLWQKIVEKNKIEFQYNISKVTEYKINFEDLISDDDINSESFMNYSTFQS
jgi:hypothetical protein